jgi:predicted HicB family RNase H-like nuclease
MPPRTTHVGPRIGAGRKPHGSAPKETTSISIDPDVLAAARMVAAERGVSFSQLVEDALKATLPPSP